MTPPWLIGTYLSRFLSRTRHIYRELPSLQRANDMDAWGCRGWEVHRHTARMSSQKARRQVARPIELGLDIYSEERNLQASAIVWECLFILHHDLLFRFQKVEYGRRQIYQEGDWHNSSCILIPIDSLTLADSNPALGLWLLVESCLYQMLYGYLAARGQRWYLC
jgi:hypothetical protein